MHILLAEDNVVNQKVASVLLGRFGYRADIVGNGEEALDAVRRQSYDLVLMDVQMPEMDGLEATKRISAEFPKEKRPEIVAMTANARPQDVQECRPLAWTASSPSRCRSISSEFCSRIQDSEAQKSQSADRTISG